MIHSFFGPIFFVSIGLEVNARHLAGGIEFFILLLLIAIVGKIAGCGLGAFACGFANRASLVVGGGMIPGGEVGLFTASWGFAGALFAERILYVVLRWGLLTTVIP